MNVKGGNYIWLKDNVMFVGKTKMYMEGKFARVAILHANHAIIDMALLIVKYVVQNLNKYFKKRAD